MVKQVASFSFNLIKSHEIADIRNNLRKGDKAKADKLGNYVDETLSNPLSLLKKEDEMPIINPLKLIKDGDEESYLVARNYSEFPLANKDLWKQFIERKITFDQYLEESLEIFKKVMKKQ
ncbi:MAG: hypothetical protein ACP5FN_01220 [Candidatus Micrarchaeia archaeon]